MLTRRRLVGAVLVMVVGLLVVVGWQVWQVQQDLRRADQAVADLRSSITAGDDGARSEALGRLRVAGRQVADRTAGPVWSALTLTPVLGDDAQGIQALGQSLDEVAGNGIQPLIDVLDDADRLVLDGRIDVEGVRALQAPVAASSDAFARARGDVAGLDTSGYVGRLRSRFDEYVAQLTELDRSLASAETATLVLPDLLGGSGVRDYLLVFQNNAEIRATGGLPGSWAQVRARGGALSIVRQGTAGEFPRLDEPVLPLAPGEEEVYSDLIGVFFQDANFTPDFPRAAELMRARWEEKYDTRLDGVMALDPVGMSYLLAGIGPVQAGDVTLTAENTVQQLLNQPYLTLAPTQQDAFFAGAARAVFTAATGRVESPVDLVLGMARAAGERRFLLASYDPAVAGRLTGAQVTGALVGDDGAEPHVEIGLNDATASKMSYYLRYRARVSSQSCAAGVQTLQGSMSLNQSILAGDAATLPESVTGLGAYGTDRGSQTVAVRIYGPTGGAFGPVSIDGAMVDVDVATLGGRPVITLLTLLSGPDDVVVNWSMSSGAGQVGAGSVGVTPGVIPGSKDSTFASSC